MRDRQARLFGILVCKEIFKVLIGKFILPKAAAVQWAIMKHIL